MLISVKCSVSSRYPIVVQLKDTGFLRSLGRSTEMLEVHIWMVRYICKAVILVLKLVLMIDHLPRRKALNCI